MLVSYTESAMLFTSLFYELLLLSDPYVGHSKAPEPTGNSQYILYINYTLINDNTSTVHSMQMYFKWEYFYAHVLLFVFLSSALS